MQPQPACDGRTAVHSTAVAVQPVLNFLEHRHAFDGQAVCDTAHNKAGPLHHDTAKPGNSIADAAAPGASSDMTHAEEEEETSSCRQQSSSSAPPHQADAEPSASHNHTVKGKEDLKRSRDFSTNNNAAGELADHAADGEEGIGEKHKGVPAKAGVAPSHYVPADVIAKWGRVMDIVAPHSTVTNCFTKTYSRFAKVDAPHLQHAVKCAQQWSYKSTSACCTS